ncbi:MAG TPA: trypsin-like peptidase domain-containing protein [Pseudonocardia sp.]|nr:trypsin-like peptidase domain-containing protein [Pseudonocardia sp.]
MAIVDRLFRPALPIDSSLSIDLSAWPNQLTSGPPPLERVSRAAAAVGRLKVTGHAPSAASPPSWVGTAFLAGPRLALAASYAVGTVAHGAGRDVHYRDDRRLSVEFIPGGEVPVEGIAFVHPYFRIALLELAPNSVEPDALVLAAASPEDLGGREVAVISCAARDPRNDAADIDRIFGRDIDQRFFVQPGQVRQIGTLSSDSGQAQGLLHDCSSLAGSGGAPLIDLSSGDVLGLHTSGTYGVMNFAEILWEFARDPVVWDYPLRFRPDPRPPWRSAWGTPSLPQPVQIPRPVAQNRAWWVDVLPIDFTAPEFKDLLRTLRGVITDTEVALNLALDAGVSRGTVDERGSAEQVWRRILERASAKGVLRTLIENIAADPEYAALAETLKRVL